VAICGKVMKVRRFRKKQAPVAAERGAMEHPADPHRLAQTEYWRSLLDRLAVLVLVVAGVDRGHPVGLAEPAPEIDVPTARRAERAVLMHARPAADRAPRRSPRLPLLMGIVAHESSSIR
jgi:hypothetical protein